MVFGADEGEIGHGNRPVMVGDHHDDEALIRIAHHSHLTYSILHSSIAKPARPAHALGQPGAPGQKEIAPAVAAVTAKGLGAKA